MNLYIINEVLFDYYPGIVIIKAKTLEDCREIFVDQYDHKNYHDEFDKAIANGEYRVLKLSRDDKMPIGVVAAKWGGS
jgi:hypothetical protein